MNKHITHKRPWRTSLLGYLGLSDLPTKVNCWYCNQDSYLLPGGKQTEQYWYCDKCENVNVKDQNGDIVDTLPVMYNASLNHPVTPIPQRHLPERRQSRTLCENCQSNQILIYQLMSEYIRDEDDPKYDYYVKTADAYKASLQEKNPLCEECQAKVENLLAEQRADLRRRRINEKLHRSLQTKSPKRPSKFQYTMQGLLWFLSHSLTVLFCILAFLYPRTQPNYTTNNQWTSIEFYKSAWSSMSTVLVDLWQRGFETNVATTLASSCGMAALTNVKDAVKTMWQSSKCIILYDRSTSEVVDDCAMAFDNISLLYIVWIISWFAIYWHPRASKTFVQDNARVRHWPTYKVILGWMVQLYWWNPSTLNSSV
ncbi:Ima1 N-terminal domain-containing protein [Radiomyces spectabilis]|uniref:Ima1 N-terminal domain-containing protein n=1 Tax=Radiomyces spectabilis TaxID=64574 RepID=UPI00221F7748|nr:Ima1 N-terminal domain-containing protein [Radiomyces spectabilis]KAI8388853.1 Ima1 N-terminal domain-containing protein [Radiomyces spectabilis]